MGLYTKWGRNKMSYTGGIIAGVLSYAFAAFILIFPIFSLINSKSSWITYLIVVPMCIYGSFCFFGVGCECIEEGKASKKAKQNIELKKSIDSYISSLNEEQLKDFVKGFYGYESKDEEDK